MLKCLHNPRSQGAQFFLLCLKTNVAITFIYRTSPLVLPEAKTIYHLGDTGSKFLTPSGEPDKSAYRTAPVVHPQPKPLYNFGEQGNKYLTPSGQPDERAYRTKPIIHAEPKTCHKGGEQGNKHLTPSSGPINENNLVRTHLFCNLSNLFKYFQPYRNSSFGAARPKTVNESRIGNANYYISCIQCVTIPFQASATGPHRLSSTQPPL